MRVTFHIPGQPIAKGRPRFNRASGRAYTPAKTVKWESTAAVMIRSEWAPQEPLRGPVKMWLTVLFERPKYMVWKTKAMPRIPHLAKPDRDNLDKIVGDTLEKAGVVRNDSQIWWGHQEKWYAAGREAPGVWIELEWEEA